MFDSAWKKTPSGKKIVRKCLEMFCPQLERFFENNNTYMYMYAEQLVVKIEVAYKLLLTFAITIFHHSKCNNDKIEIRYISLCDVNYVT